MRKIMGALVVGASVAVLAAAAQQTAAAAPVDAEILSAMQRDLGLTAAQATRWRAQQDKAVALDGDIRASLGTAFSGSYFDAGTGKLVVNVTDPARAAQVRKAGAVVRVVERGQAELNAIQGELNTLSRGRSSAAAGLAAWHVDPKSNAVVVTVVEGTRPAALDAVARHGDAVRVEYVAEAPETTKWLNGGEAIYSDGSRCSAGFNLNNPETGQTYMLTAGHCVEPLADVDGEGGHLFGNATESFFPRWDHAIVKAQNTDYWQQGPYVQTNDANGGYLTVTSVSDLPVGSAMCKSGSTTGWTCGTITAKNESVRYSGQPEPTLYLTRNTACAEPGDSGGSNVGSGTTWTAEGMSSGATMTTVDGKKRCLATIGQENRSWYYPAAKALEYYGPRFNVRLM